MGRVVNIFNNDLREGANDIGHFWIWICNSFTGVVNSLIICIYATTSWVLVLSIVIFIIAAKIQRYFMKTHIECCRLESVNRSAIVSGFSSVVSGVATIRAYDRSEEFFEKEVKKLTFFKRLQTLSYTVDACFDLRVRLVILIINLSVFLFSFLAMEPNPTLFGLIVLNSLSLNYGMQGILESIRHLQSKLISLERANSMANIEPEQGYVNCSME